MKLTIKKMQTQVLNKVYRKINLDVNVQEWSKSRGGIQWIKLLGSIDDYKLQKIVGTDIALYLIWLRYCAVFFACVSFLNMFMIAFYLTGQGQAEYQDNGVKEDKKQK